MGLKTSPKGLMLQHIGITRQFCVLGSIDGQASNCTQGVVVVVVRPGAWAAAIFRFPSHKSVSRADVSPIPLKEGVITQW